MSLQRPPRDTRLDLLRGWLQLQIFASHAHGSLIGAWLISAAWGLSDSSEQFVYLSGFVLGSVFTLKAHRGGWRAGLADLGPRIRRLWTTHMVVLCAMAAMVLAVEMTVPLPGEAARLGWSWLAEAPWLALPAAGTLLWQPIEMGILPVFIWSMLLLPGFLWLAERFGPWALAPSLALYLAVQEWGWQVPGLGGREVEFNPLAWQALFLLGAWFGRRALLHGRAIGLNRWGLGAALLVLAAGAGLRLASHLGALDVSGLDDKQHLAPARMLHSLSLAYAVVALWRVREVALRGPLLRALAAAGRQSLHVFCVGLFLSYGLAVLFRQQGWQWWLEALVVLGGLALLGFATAAEWSPGLARGVKNPQK
ncbi:OpgC domain-containing protein [Paracraurococcus lichenis]|uniref:OpgC domain-containing protein n=1 Tax=Paracraurococcus lichenis TaxID=3064888 RepID=A0ABT9DTM7_9PROT|nr:OpgC domain-containing protein [Paracraurococcus sp. LOR1-02]MDO9707252.1 OpgC domain-containing protein [Paracraurococcus sp. LOR1-02]